MKGKRVIVAFTIGNTAGRECLSGVFTLTLKNQGDGSSNDIAVLSVLSALRDIAHHLRNIAVRIPAM